MSMRSVAQPLSLALCTWHRDVMRVPHKKGPIGHTQTHPGTHSRARITTQELPRGQRGTRRAAISGVVKPAQQTGYLAIPEVLVAFRGVRRTHWRIC